MEIEKSFITSSDKATIRACIVMIENMIMYGSVNYDILFLISHTLSLFIEQADEE